jgi:Tol biopolymer transport system component
VGAGTDNGSPRPQLDIVLYDRDHGALHRLEPPSTVQADEFFPSFSAKARYMVYTTTAPGNADIWRLDLKTMLIDTLPQMNSPGNALRAAVSDDGNLIAFSEADGDRTVLKLYDVITNFLSVPEAPNRFGTNVLVRDVAPNGHVIAYSVINDGQADIELYDVARGIIVTPPFINSGFNDLSPTFSPDGTQLVFVSDRFGSLDIMLVDLLTGMLDTLPLANSPQADVDPVFLPDGEIAFQTNRAGEPDLFFYDVRTQLLDTAPIANPDDDPNFGASPGPG